MKVVLDYDGHFKREVEVTGQTCGAVARKVVGLRTGHYTLWVNGCPLNAEDSLEEGMVVTVKVRQLTKKERSKCIERLPALATPGAFSDVLEGLEEEFGLPCTWCRQLVLVAVRIDGTELWKAAPHLQDDKEIVMNAVWNAGDAVRFASSTLKGDPDIAQAVLKKDPVAYQYLSEEARGDKELALLAVSKLGANLEHVAPELLEDLDVVSAALRKSAYAMEYLPVHIRSAVQQRLAAGSSPGNDARLVLDFGIFQREVSSSDSIQESDKWLEGLRQSFYTREELKHESPPRVLIKVRELTQAEQAACIGYATELHTPGVYCDLLGGVEERYLLPCSWCREVVLHVVQLDGTELYKAARHLRADKTVVLRAVSTTGPALQFASAELRDDADVAWEALRANPSAYKFVSPRLRGNREMAEYAVTMLGANLEHVTSGLEEDQALVLKALSKSQYAADYVAPALLGDAEFMLRALRYGASVICRSPLRDDGAFLSRAVKVNARVVEYHRKGWEGDRPIPIREVVLREVRGNGMALGGVAEEYTRDRDVVLAAVKHTPKAYLFVHPELRGDPTTAKCAVVEEENLALVPSEALGEPSVAHTALQTTPTALDYLPDHLFEDKGFVSDAVRTTPEVLSRARFPMDDAFVSDAVTGNAEAIHYLPSEVMGSGDVMLRLLGLVEQRVRREVLLPMLQSTLLSSRRFVLEAVQIDEEVLLHAPSFADDPVVVRGLSQAVVRRAREQLYLGFVDSHSCRCRWCFAAAFPSALQGLLVHEGVADWPREVVLAALQRDGRELQYVTNQDSELVMTAVRQSSEALRYVHHIEPHHVLEALRYHPDALEVVTGSPLLSDKGFLLKAVAIAPQVLSLSPLRNDFTFVKEALLVNVDAAGFLAYRIPDDIVLSLVSVDCGILRYIDDELRHDETFMRQCVEINQYAIRHCSPQQVAKFPVSTEVARELLDEGVRGFGRSSIREVALLGLATHGDELKGSPWTDDKQAVLAAVRSNGAALQFASEGLRGDREVVQAAVANHPPSLTHAALALRFDRSFLRGIPPEAVFGSHTLRADIDLVLALADGASAP